MIRQGLIIVDVQKDFCPGGALPAGQGNEIIPVINQLIPKFDYVIASKDWHPQKTVHFDKWPPHCIRGAKGAAFHEGLNLSGIHLVALKGTGNTDDGYSAFEATNIDMEFELKRKNIHEVYITGIATEYCVLSTAMDALKSGFKVNVITDAVAAVEQQSGDHEKALTKMQKAGIILLTSEMIILNK